MSDGHRRPLADAASGPYDPHIMTPTDAATTASGGSSRPTKILPTPRIAFPKQVDLLRAYAAASGDGASGVPLSAASSIVGMANSTISLANPFFQDIGLLVKAENGFLPSPEVVSFSDVFKWDQGSAGTELAPILKKSWFGLALIPRASFGDLPYREAVTILAREARAEPRYGGQIRMLIDYLELAQIVVREGDLLRGGISIGVDRASASPTNKPTAQTPTAKPVTADRPQDLPLLVQGLLQQLPTGREWTRAKSEKWIELAKLTFEVVYDFAPPTELTKPSPPTGEAPGAATPAASRLPDGDDDDG
jgi:hypothetical protein